MNNDARASWRTHKADNQKRRCDDPGRREEENNRQRSRNTVSRAVARLVPEVLEHKAHQCADARIDPGREEENNQQCSRNTVSRAVARLVPGVLEHEAQQRAGAREQPGVLEHKAQQCAGAREQPGVLEHEAQQCASARAIKFVKMATKFVDGKFFFCQPCGKWNEECSHGRGYIHYQVQPLGPGRNVALMTACHLIAPTLMRN
jgi:hypothetical protein